jgi:hypothetical protein
LSRSSVRPKQKSFELTDEIRGRIALKAYELYEQRGRDGSQEMEHWLEAEALVMKDLRREGM